MEKFTVVATRTTVETVSMTVKAENKKEAIEIAKQNQASMRVVKDEGKEVSFKKFEALV